MEVACLKYHPPLSLPALTLSYFKSLVFHFNVSLAYHKTKGGKLTLTGTIFNAIICHCFMVSKDTMLILLIISTEMSWK